MTCGHDFMVPGAHPALAGHFPDMPVVPGSVILDHVLAAWGQPCLSVPSAKFHAPLGPDQRVHIEFKLSHDGMVRFRCRRGADLICSGRIAVVPSP